MNKTLCLMVLGVSIVACLAEESDKPTLFVAPLDGDMAQIQGWQPALGEGLAEMLISEVSKLGKFTVLESTAIEHLKDEIRLGEDGYVGDKEKVEKGGFAGADFMLRGKVTRFGAKKQGVDLGGFVPGSGGSLGIGSTMADVRIDWRLVDAANRKIVTSGNAVGSQSGPSFNIGVGVTGHGGRIGYENKEFMNSALGRATVKAVSNIVLQVNAAQIPESARRKSKAAAAAQADDATKGAAAALHNTPGKVLAVPSKGVLIVSLGSKHGFRNGDKLRLYETVDTKDDNGNVVFTEEKLVGEITLDAVQEDKSKASYSGASEVKQGWAVKAN